MGGGLPPTRAGQEVPLSSFRRGCRLAACAFLPAPGPGPQVRGARLCALRFCGASSAGPQSPFQLECLPAPTSVVCGRRGQHPPLLRTEDPLAVGRTPHKGKVVGCVWSFLTGQALPGACLLRDVGQQDRPGTALGGAASGPLVQEGFSRESR